MTRYRLRRLWSSPITVRLAPTVDLAPPRMRWQRIAPGVLDSRAQLTHKFVEDQDKRKLNSREHRSNIRRLTRRRDPSEAK